MLCLPVAAFGFAQAEAKPVKPQTITIKLEPPDAEAIKEAIRKNYHGITEEIVRQVKVSSLSESNRGPSHYE